MFPKTSTRLGILHVAMGWFMLDFFFKREKSWPQTVLPPVFMEGILSLLKLEMAESGRNCFLSRAITSY